MSLLVALRGRYLRYASLLLIAAIGIRAGYAWVFEASQLPVHPYWLTKWIVGYACFLFAYIAVSQEGFVRARRTQLVLLALQAISAIYLVWLYPSFIVTCLLVVVAWQIGWIAPLRTAIILALLQAGVLALMKCVGETDGLPFLILIITCGFQAFAISAAHLARSEAAANDELERVNSELRATQALMAESARMSERLRISRDLHDVLGHNLTTLAIHLDVADRLTIGQASEHVQCARKVTGDLLSQVRNVVSRVNVEPPDLRAALRRLVDDVVGIEVALDLPDELFSLDPTRADAIFHCVQEILTNTLRHSQARHLAIALRQAAGGAVEISAQDDGHGGDIKEGLGLSGMRERFELLGGKLSFRSDPNVGFGLNGSIPANSKLS